MERISTNPEPVTLEQAHDSALAAAAAGDLGALEEALRFRAAAFAALKHAPPSEELFQRMSAALQAGESIANALTALKQRIGCESVRLTQLKTGLTAGFGLEPKTHINYRA